MGIGVILLTACDNKSASQKSNLVEDNSSYSIPSFGNKKIIGCDIEKKNTNQECSDQNELSSSAYILNQLTEDKEEPLKEEVSKLNSPLSDSEQLSMLVAEENNIKRSEQERENSAKDDLEKLVSSAKDLETDNASIGRFDKEQFKYAWEELESLVASNEDSSVKQENLKLELENLVLSASSNKNNRTQHTKKVKALINTSTKDSSIENRKFIENIVSDLSHQKIELIESNEKWIKIKIKQGDTLAILAKNYYGDEYKFRIIYNANREKIKDDYMIYVGDTLKIPTLNSIKGL